MSLYEIIITILFAICFCALTYGLINNLSMPHKKNLDHLPSIAMKTDINTFVDRFNELIEDKNERFIGEVNERSFRIRYNAPSSMIFLGLWFYWITLKGVFGNDGNIYYYFTGAVS